VTHSKNPVNVIAVPIMSVVAVWPILAIHLLVPTVEVKYIMVYIHIDAGDHTGLIYMVPNFIISAEIRLGYTSGRLIIITGLL